MRYNRILLVNSILATSNTGALRPNAGVGYIAEILSQNKITYDVVDMALGYKMRHLKQKILEFRPDLVGFSMMTFGYKKTYELINEIKTLPVKFDVVVGGSHISTEREDVLGECSGIDLGSVLEGEKTIIELCQGKELSEIKGLIYRDSNRVIYTGNREFETDLDSIPFPKYEKFELNKYLTKEIPLVTSRGCPFDCIFCAVETAVGRKFRARSQKYVVDEISCWVKRGYSRFTVIDDNFTLLKNRVYGICEELERRNLTNLSLRLGNGVRADKLDYDLLKRMKEVGFWHIVISAEAGNNRILKNLNKRETIEEIKQAVKNACDVGFDVTLNFLVGSPGETWNDIEDSVKLALEFPVFEARFHNLIPFSKTKLFEWIRKNGHFVESPSKYLNYVSQWIDKPVFFDQHLSLDERKKALSYTAKIRKTIMQKSIQRKLKAWGLLGKIFAGILVSDWGQRMFYYNRTFRRFIDTGRKLHLQKDRNRKRIGNSERSLINIF